MNMHRKDVLKGRSIVSKNIFDAANQTIDEIKRNHPLMEYFQRRGVALTKSGSEYKGLCPFHDDHNPSLSVNAEKGVFKCFGCGKAGTVIDAVAYYDNIGTGDAIKVLQKTLPQSRSIEMIAPASESIGEQSPQPDERVAIEGSVFPPMNETPDVVAPPPSSDDEPALHHEGWSSGDIETVEVNTTDGLGVNALTTVAEYYHRRLYQSTDAIEYLKKRGLTRPEIWQRFNIGFALALSVVEGDGGLLSMISDAQRAELVEIGILHQYDNSTGESTYREHFHNCIIFPITDDMNITVGMYGRNIADNAKFPHLYLKGDKQDALVPSADRMSEKRSAKHRGIFNRRASKVYDEIILTESIIDCLSLVELGIENVQPIYGVNGFTDEHLQILKDDRVKTIVIGFDNDEAGIKASAVLKDKLIGEGFAVKIIYPPKTDESVSIKDWNEYLITASASTSLSNLAATIKELIQSAEIHKSPSEDKHFTVSKSNLGIVFQTGDIIYRVTGVKDVFVANLKVNVRAELVDTGTGEIIEKYYDNLDLYSARGRNSYSQNLGRMFNQEPKRVEKDLIAILEHLEAERDRNLLSAQRRNDAVELTVDERKLGMEFLQSKNLFEQIVHDLEILGYVGEDLNKKLLYLAASSRILDDPISVLILSQSAAGKSMLVDVVRKLIPAEDVIAVTSLSDQALNYVSDLMHKFLILGEAVHSDIIEHQIREMLSGKELSRLVAVKDEKTGQMSSKEIKTPAVVAAVMSGTNREINPENASRCFLVNADESKEQTRRIHAAQRSKYSLDRLHLRMQQVPEIVKKHHAAQRLLRKHIIINQFAGHLNFPDTLMRTRRDHDRFIDLIACVCFLRQHQKSIRCDGDISYIECDLEDYAIAHDIMVNGVLSSTMTEIPRGTIDFYETLREMAHKSAKKQKLEPHEVSFTQRDVREHTGFGQTWVKQNLRMLADYEYVIRVKGGERSRGYYRLKEDVDIQKLDLSMIPTPSAMQLILETMSNEHKMQ